MYEGGISDSLYDVFSQIVGNDSAKIVSASWTNGCEAYVGQSLQDSENTLFQAAAAEGPVDLRWLPVTKAHRVATSTGKIEATTGIRSGGTGRDPSTGTLYIANKSSNTVSVDSEGSASNPYELR